MTLVVSRPVYEPGGLRNDHKPPVAYEYRVVVLNDEPGSVVSLPADERIVAVLR